LFSLPSTGYSSAVIVQSRICASHATVMNFPIPSDSAATSSISNPAGSLKGPALLLGDRGPSVIAL